MEKLEDAITITINAERLGVDDSGTNYEGSINQQINEVKTSLETCQGCISNITTKIESWQGEDKNAFDNVFTNGLANYINDLKTANDILAQKVENMKQDVATLMGNKDSPTISTRMEPWQK